MYIPRNGTAHGKLPIELSMGQWNVYKLMIQPMSRPTLRAQPGADYGTAPVTAYGTFGIPWAIS